jgi:hypothetical protein
MGHRGGGAPDHDPSTGGRALPVLGIGNPDAASGVVQLLGKISTADRGVKEDTVAAVPSIVAHQEACATYRQTILSNVDNL